MLYAHTMYKGTYYPFILGADVLTCIHYTKVPLSIVLIICGTNVVLERESLT